MFTSEPSLIQRIERLIRDTRIIDPRTQIGLDQPGAPDLGSLLCCHEVQTELRAVGMSREDLDASLPADERVRRALPSLRRMRNTAVAWCFYRILRDLYDFHDPHLDESNYRDVLDRVESTGRDPGWPRQVLRDRCRVETFVTSLGNKGTNPSTSPPADVKFMLDAHYLVCPGVATDLLPFFPGRTTKGEYYEALTSILGDRPATPQALSRGLLDWLDATVRGDVRFTNVFLPIEARFLEPDTTETGRVLARAARGEPLDDTSVDALTRAVSWTLLEWHHEHRKAFQIAVGAESLCDGKSIPRFQQTWTTEMARTFHRFPGVRFDLLIASDVLAHEAAVLARQFPNVYLSGDWWHNFTPPTIEKNLSLRLQVAPMVKFSGFLSDASYVEWSYSKLQVVRKAMASAFARLIESGYYEEEEIPPILGQILYQTPRDLYSLA